MVPFLAHPVNYRYNEDNKIKYKSANKSTHHVQSKMVKSGAGAERGEDLGQSVHTLMTEAALRHSVLETSAASCQPDAPPLLTLAP